MVMMQMSAGLATKVANNRKGNGNGISSNDNREGSWDMQEREWKQRGYFAMRQQ